MSVFVPGHVTGFFNIENHESKLKNGSCGVGFLLTKGVKTTIIDSDRFEYEVNELYTGRSATKKYIRIKWQALPNIMNK